MRNTPHGDQISQSRNATIGSSSLFGITELELLGLNTRFIRVKVLVPPPGGQDGPSGEITEFQMRKFLTLFAVVVFSATALITSTKDADARRWRGGGYGGAVAAAIIGSALIYGINRHHHRRHYYSSYGDGYGYGYYPRRRYYSSGFYNAYPYYGNRGYYRHKHYGHRHFRGHRHGFYKHHHRGHRGMRVHGRRW